MLLTLSIDFQLTYRHRTNRLLINDEVSAWRHSWRTLDAHRGSIRNESISYPRADGVVGWTWCNYVGITVCHAYRESTDGWWDCNIYSHNNTPC